jgi:hypothetical protein
MQRLRGPFPFGSLPPQSYGRCTSQAVPAVSFAGGLVYLNNFWLTPAVGLKEVSSAEWNATPEVYLRVRWAPLHLLGISAGRTPALGWKGPKQIRLATWSAEVPPASPLESASLIWGIAQLSSLLQFQRGKRGPGQPSGHVSRMPNGTLTACLLPTAFCFLSRSQAGTRRPSPRYAAFLCHAVALLRDALCCGWLSQWFRSCSACRALSSATTPADAARCCPRQVPHMSEVPPAYEELMAKVHGHKHHH